jgi:uncharacterized membrane protein
MKFCNYYFMFKCYLNCNLVFFILACILFAISPMNGRPVVFTLISMVGVWRSLHVLILTCLSLYNDQNAHVYRWLSSVPSSAVVAPA